MLPNGVELSEAAKDFIAGGLGGAAGVVAGQPLDVVRIRMQQPECRYRGIVDGCRAIVRQEGLQSLFKGMSYPLLTVALQNAVCFQAYGLASRHLSGSLGSEASSAAAAHAATPSSTQLFFSGVFAGAVQTLVTTPQELLKIRLQVQKAVPGETGYRGPLRLLWSILRQEGVPGLFRGQAVTLLRDAPSYGLYFLLYQAVGEALAPGLHNQSASSFTTQLLAGGVAGSAAWASIYPLDVVKSRLQARQYGLPAPACHAVGAELRRSSAGCDSAVSLGQSLRSPASDSLATQCCAASPHAQAPARRVYRNAVDCAVQSFRQEGLGVFFRGCGATVSRAFAVNAVIFAVYESVWKRLEGLAVGAAPSL